MSTCESYEKPEISVASFLHNINSEKIFIHEEPPEG
jgi:hypothetical protein